MTIQRWTWTRTDGLGTDKHGEVWAEAMLCDHENSLQTESRLQQFEHGSRKHGDLPGGIRKEECPWAQDWKQRWLGFPGIGLFTSCSAQEIACILCKLDWKDTANFVQSLLFLLGTGQGNSIAAWFQINVTHLNLQLVIISLLWY